MTALVVLASSKRFRKVDQEERKGSDVPRTRREDTYDSHKVRPWPQCSIKVVGASKRQLLAILFSFCGRGARHLDLQQAAVSFSDSRE